MGRVVLVTGVSRDLGLRFARGLVEGEAHDTGVDRVIGVDVVPPRGDLGGVSFVRADIRNPVIAKVIAREDVDTVVHMSVIATPGTTGGRGTMKELNVIGTMQLLAACQKAPGVRKLVVKSTTTVYGASNRDPAMFTEDAGPKQLPRSGYAKDSYEIEGYVRGFARRRPDVSLTLLRCANVMGREVVSPIASYFRLPVIPRVLGFDPRLQFLHDRDLLAVLRHAVVGEHPGTFNVAGDGVVLLSQAIRRTGRPSIALPTSTLGGVSPVLGRARLADLSPELLNLLRFGRGVDTSRMRTMLGFHPRMTTAEAFADFVAALPAVPNPVGRALLDLTERWAEPAPAAAPGATIGGGTRG